MGKREARKVGRVPVQGRLVFSHPGRQDAQPGSEPPARSTRKCPSSERIPKCVSLPRCARQQRDQSGCRGLLRGRLALPVNVDSPRKPRDPITIFRRRLRMSSRVWKGLLQFPPAAPMPRLGVSLQRFLQSSWIHTALTQVDGEKLLSQRSRVAESRLAQTINLSSKNINLPSWRDLVDWPDSRRTPQRRRPRAPSVHNSSILPKPKRRDQPTARRYAHLDNHFGPTFNVDARNERTPRHCQHSGLGREVDDASLFLLMSPHLEATQEENHRRGVSHE